MHVLKAGHKYLLDNLKSTGQVPLDFYMDSEINGEGSKGTNCQEVIRALIDRILFLDSQKQWAGNEEIVQHLRASLALLESRAIQRKVDKGLLIESLPVGLDGHLIFGENE
jgi:hypothetical protein